MFPLPVFPNQCFPTPVFVHTGGEPVIVLPDAGFVLHARRPGFVVNVARPGFVLEDAQPGFVIQDRK